MNKVKINYLVDGLVFLSLLVSAVTGVILFIFFPAGTQQGRFQEFLGIKKLTFIGVHNIVSLILIALVIIHLSLHYKWITSMTANFFKRSKDNVKEIS